MSGLLIMANWQATCYNRPWYAGIDIAPRGKACREALNFHHVFWPGQRLINHVQLPLNMEYLKHELRWYVNADYADESIAEHAAMWNDVRNPDGKWLSNYGYWLWGEPQRLAWVIEELKRDPDSRRAVVHINTPDHLSVQLKDIPCTMYLAFHIRTNVLYTAVHMRSQDAVWGLRNDLPFFWMVADIVSKAVGVPVGNLYLFVNSFHIYERHYEKVRNLILDPDGWIPTKLDWSSLVTKVLNEKLKIESKAGRNDGDSPGISGPIDVHTA